MQRQVPSNHSERLGAVELALEGLSVGDALGSTLGEGFLKKPMAIALRQIPDGPHRWTDDTAMAVELAGVLELRGTVDTDLLSRAFVARYVKEPDRGYGGGAHRLLTAIAKGADWRTQAKAMFGGTGSMGNGSAMRVAPIGAYFADDVPRLKEEAALSALPTHWNDDGQAGAIAVALAAGWAWCHRDTKSDGRALLDHVLEHMPRTPTRERLELALGVPLTADSLEGAAVLGNGSQVICFDTVPFVIWSAARSLDSYERAFWDTARAGGDVDTTCAMVGAIVALAGSPPPQAWVRAREPLPHPLVLTF